MQRTIAIVGVGISLAFGQVDRASADLLDLSAAPVFQSSEYDPNYNVATAFDNSLVEPSRWASSPTGDEFRQEWIYVDLGMDRQLNSVAIDWQAANARTFSVRAWPSALGDPGGAATDPNDPNWSAVATATETNAAPADAFIGDDQKFDFAAGFAFDPTNLGGTLEVNTLNPVARYLMIETSRQSVYNLSSIWEVRVDADAPNSPIKLQVNTVSGQVSIVNNASLAEARNINSYQIVSEGNSLDHGSWDGLGGQTGFPAGNGTGNGWEEGESSGDDSLAEAFLLGGSDVALNATLSLEAAYDASVDARDLVFLYSETDGLLRRGTVEYISAAVPGDYNSNGVVDAADYTVWRDHLGQSFQLANEVSGVTPGTVTSQDYDAWKSRFGNTSGSGAALGGTTAVPEPSTCGLCVLLALVGLARRTIRRRPLRTTVAGIGAIGRSCDNATHN